ncbi:glycosyltransferase family 32 protein [Adlercreutzia sp. ZJ141]|uniref:glycosyltransferase family 32 protein n=1 Tax=Adlercreutzia sp. ZJ141 TaxID=2709406 RepID=UPI0013ED2DB9|nr:glycosyltransferase [Adlercreutzia sp. ZJ141]
MIPKVIHYIWFGGNQLSPLAKRCIASWEKYCPDYEIKRWDESNFDVMQNRYCREAYEAKKWAFVSDYARLWILTHEGGIYMDTDVEVLGSLDLFLDEEAFSGFESETQIPTGLMACRDSFPLFVRLLRDYDNRVFLKPDGTFDTTTNVIYITEACLDEGLVLNGEKQTIAGFTLYPQDYFCPKDYRTKQLRLTKNTRTIHHFDGSWLPPEVGEFQRRRDRLVQAWPFIPRRSVAALAMLQTCMCMKSSRPLSVWLEAKKSHGGVR